MPIRRLIPLSVAMLTASMSAVHAGSCSDDIDQMQARIDARVEAIAAAGPFVPPGISAGNYKTCEQALTRVRRLMHP
jgi:hypothetical protein